MPLPWGRRLRYRIGRLFFGGTIFAPYLERESWQSQCFNRRGAARRARPAARPSRQEAAEAPARLWKH
jgi:hypothetical protein